MSGVDRIAAERATHEARGYTAAHDDQWKSNELAQAAVCHAAPGLADYQIWAWLWPWDSERPTRATSPEQRIEQLAKAGALIAAEIDRLERFAAKKPAIVDASDDALEIVG